MGMNTQKLIVSLILLNLMIVIASNYYYASETYRTSGIGDELEENVYGYGQDWEDEDLLELVREDQQDEGTVGNIKRMGSIIWETFTVGIQPFVITNDENDQVEWIVLFALNGFKFTLYALLGLELYLLIKNRKTGGG